MFLSDLFWPVCKPARRWRRFCSTQLLRSQVPAFHAPVFWECLLCLLILMANGERSDLMWKRSGCVRSLAQPRSGVYHFYFYSMCQNLVQKATSKCKETVVHLFSQVAPASPATCILCLLLSSPFAVTKPIHQVEGWRGPVPVHKSQLSNFQEF